MKLKKIIASLVIAAIIVSLIIYGNVKEERKPQNNETKILTSFYPIYIMTLNVTNGAKNIEVSNMAEKLAGCIHDYTLTTTDLRKFENADIFIQNGAGLENFSDKIASSYPNVKIINAAQNVTNFIYSDGKNDDSEAEYEKGEEGKSEAKDNKEKEGKNETKDNKEKEGKEEKSEAEGKQNKEEKNNEKDESGEEEESNSHIWLSIENYKKEDQEIATELSTLNLENADIYRKNCNTYLQKLDDLQEKFKKLNLQGEKAICLNESLEYLLKENDIDETLVETDHEQASISAKMVKDIISKMQEENIKSIFIDKDDSDKLAKVLQNETNAKIYVLNSGMNGNDDLNSYINIMEENLKTLKQIKSESN